MTEEQTKQLKYDFESKVATVTSFLEMFVRINGIVSVYTALERFLEERNLAIVQYYDKKVHHESDTLHK